MQLPNELVLLIGVTLTGFVSWLCVEGIKGISEAFGKDLSSFAKIVAGIVSTAVVGSVIGIINAALALVPAEYQSIAQQILALLVAVFSAYGVQRQAKKARPFA
jgi:uncharacterized membrane protein